MTFPNTYGARAAMSLPHRHYVTYSKLGSGEIIMDENEPSEMMTEIEAAKALESNGMSAVVKVAIIDWKDGTIEDVSEKIAEVWMREFGPEWDNCTGEPFGVPPLVQEHCSDEIDSLEAEGRDMRGERIMAEE